MSRFVSAGTDADSRPLVDDGWLRAQQAVEASKKPKSAEPGTQDGGKSLYEVLQANKAAKQDAFEEAARLKNQFRALDEDEIDFLDSVLESSRAKEDAVKQDTTEQLEAFRKKRVAAEQALSEGPDAGAATADKDVGLWATTKRKRRRDKEAQTNDAVKLRKLSTVESEKPASKASSSVSPVKPEAAPQPDPNDTKTPPVPTKPPSDRAPTTTNATLGLAGYSSDEDD